MHTNGFELEVGWNDKIGDWRYSISANLSDFKSKMGDLGGTEFLGDQVKKKVANLMNGMDMLQRVYIKRRKKLITLPY